MIFDTTSVVYAIYRFVAEACNLDRSISVEVLCGTFAKLSLIKITSLSRDDVLVGRQAEWCSAPGFWVVKNHGVDVYFSIVAIQKLTT